MRRALLTIFGAVTIVAGAGIAHAQSTQAPAPGEPAAVEPSEPRADGQSPNITVKEDRLVCKRRERTGTRMGTSRVCRTQSEWNQVEREQARNGEEAADTLSVLSEAATTGDLGGMSGSGDGPLGPR